MFASSELGLGQYLWRHTQAQRAAFYVTYNSALKIFQLPARVIDLAGAFIGACWMRWLTSRETAYLLECREYRIFVDQLRLENLQPESLQPEAWQIKNFREALAVARESDPTPSRLADAGRRLQFLRRLSRQIQFVWERIVRTRIFQWISVSLLVVVSWSLYAFFDLNRPAEKTIIVANDNFEMPPELSIYVSAIFPVDDRPRIWDKNSAYKISAGFDEGQASLTDFIMTPAECRASYHVLFSSTSVSGNERTNQSIGRSRSANFGNGLRHARSRCSPASAAEVVRVSLMSPQSSADDGGQRRLFAVALGKDSEIASGVDVKEVIDRAIDAIDPHLGVAPDRYAVIEFCVEEVPFESCRWTRFEQSEWDGRRAKATVELAEAR